MRLAILALCACTSSPVGSSPKWIDVDPTIAADFYAIVGTASGMWGLATTDANARADLLLAWDGAAWSTIGAVDHMWTMQIIGGEVWLGGDAGKLVVYDGVSLASIDTGGTMPIYSMWGASAGDLWLTQGTSLDHWDGTSITPSPVASAVNAVSGTAANDVWAVGAAISHFDGTTWTSVPATLPAAATYVLAVAPDLAWASGPNFVLRWNGSAWNVDAGLPASGSWKLFGSTRDQVWATNTGTGGIMHWTGDSWAAWSIPHDGGYRFVPSAIWVDASGNAWGVANGGATVLADDACGWRYVAGAIAPDSGVTGVWVSGSETWFSVAPSGALMTYDDCGLRGVDMRIPDQNDFDAGIAGTSSSDLWLVGAYGGIEHWDGSTFAYPVSLPFALHGAWARSASDVWAVGDAGQIEHYDGTAWTAVTSPAIGWLTAVTGSGQSDAWIVGEGGTILYWDGAAWSLEDAGTSAWLGGVWSDGHRVYAVGEAGTILVREGGEWRAMASGTDRTLMAVSGNGANVWAVGEQGTVLRLESGEWRPVAIPTSQALGAIGVGEHVWVGGSGGTLFRTEP